MLIYHSSPCSFILGTYRGFNQVIGSFDIVTAFIPCKGPVNSYQANFGFVNTLSFTYNWANLFDYNKNNRLMTSNISTSLIEIPVIFEEYLAGTHTCTKKSCNCVNHYQNLANDHLGKASSNSIYSIPGMGDIGIE